MATFLTALILCLSLSVTALAAVEDTGFADVPGDGWFADGGYWARLGRAFGIHLILATQRPNANILPGQAKNNLDFRVCGRTDDTLSGIILGNNSADD